MNLASAKIRLNRFDGIPLLRYNEGMNVIRELRTAIKEDGRSLYKLAKDAGLRYSVVHPLATGDKDNPTIETMNKLAAALGYDLRLIRKGR